MSLFYKTLNLSERRRPQLSQCSVKRRLRGGGGRKLESLRFPSSSSAPAPGSGGESQQAVATVTRAALPDPITAGGAHPHIQTSFTRDLNIGG